MLVCITLYIIFVLHNVVCFIYKTKGERVFYTNEQIFFGTNHILELEKSRCQRLKIQLYIKLTSTLLKATLDLSTSLKLDHIWFISSCIFYKKNNFIKRISIIDYSFYLCFYFDMDSLVLVFYCVSFTWKSRFIYSIREHLFVEFLLFEWHVCTVPDSNTQTDKVLQVS